MLGLTRPQLAYRLKRPHEAEASVNAQQHASPLDTLPGRP
jgi:hypothetical protein